MEGEIGRECGRKGEREQSSCIIIDYRMYRSMFATFY